MKKLLLPIALIVLSCSPEDSCEPTPKLTTAEAENITDVSATISGTITPPTCDDTVTSQGFVYGEENLPTVDDTKIVKSGSSISASLTNLNQNTTYYIRTFFENPLGVFYGNQVDFTTATGSISFGSSVLSVFPEYAKLSISITDDGNGTISDVGIYYSTENNVGVNDSFMSGYEFELIELTPNTKYYFVAVASNESGQYISDVYSFTTTNSDFSSNPNASEISKNSAKIEAKINHNYQLIEDGMLYSRHTNNLSLDNNTTTVLSNETEFNISALLPNTTYYFKGYSKYLKNPNSEAFYVYSNTVSFTTAPNSLANGILDEVVVNALDNTNRNFNIKVLGNYNLSKIYIKGFGFVIVERNSQPNSAGNEVVTYQIENVFNGELFQFGKDFYSLGNRRKDVYVVIEGWDNSKHYFGGIGIF